MTTVHRGSSMTYFRIEAQYCWVESIMTLTSGFQEPLTDVPRQ